MRYDFAKLNGLGNDFVMIEDLNDKITLTPDQIAAVCDRHFGVGADGVIIVKPSPRPECVAYMDYYNSDGTKAQMCGNGVRCFAKFLVDRNIIDSQAGSFIADTLAGPKPISFTLDDNGKLACATVDMGAPILEPLEVPTTFGGTETPFGRVACDAEFYLDGRMLRFTCVSMGNPHAVTFVDKRDLELVNSLGPLIETCEAFPEGTNVEFAWVDGDTIHMRVWERGCGETLACGTGACATAVAAHICGHTPRKVTLELIGGTLQIEWRESDGHVMMTGPAAESFTGSFEL